MIHSDPGQNYQSRSVMEDYATQDNIIKQQWSHSHIQKYDERISLQSNHIRKMNK